MFGSSTPSWNTAHPMPVPNVIMMTTPPSSRPAPKRISAMPAASASFRARTGRPIRAPTFSAMFTPIHSFPMFAAVFTAPPMITPGKVRPTTPVVVNEATT